MRLGRIFGATAIAILLTSVQMVWGQIGGGLNDTTRTDLGGRNYITGTVFDPTGAPVRTRMRIRLASVNIGREVVATTDEYGRFVFSGVSHGTYTLNIDDDGTGEYEQAVQTIDVTSGGLPQSHNFSIRLSFKKRSMKAQILRAELAGVPKKAVDHYQKALSLAAEDNVRAAVKELEAAISAFPAFTLALTELGVQQLRMGRLEDADRSLKAALELKPDLFEALVNRGIGLFRQQKYKDAEPFLRSAIAAKPDSLVAHFYLGRVMMGVGDLEAAEKELTLVLSDEKAQIIESHRMLTQLYIEKHDYEKALQQLDAYLAANPQPHDEPKLRNIQKQLQDAVAATRGPRRP